MAREEKERNEKILRAEKMKKGWELQRICMQFIRDNSERWKREEQARQEKKKDEAKQARKDLAERQRIKCKENLMQKKITEKMRKLPVKEK